MKKLIALFLILSILVIGCSKNQNYRQEPNPQSPAIGGGCSVTTESENQEMQIKYIRVNAGL